MTAGGNGARPETESNFATLHAVPSSTSPTSAMNSLFARIPSAAPAFASIAPRTPSRAPNRTRPGSTNASVASCVASLMAIKRNRGAILQRMISGATTRSPVASPSHHVSQIAPYCVQLAKPPKARLLTPNMGLITVLNMTATVNLKTSCERSKTRIPLAKRLTSQAPQTASSVLPVAIQSEVEILPAVVALTKNAPTKIAGQTR